MILSQNVRTTLIVAGAATVLAALTAVFIAKQRPQPRRPQPMPASLVRSAKVTELWVHPVKGMSGTKVTSAVIVPTGFRYDREWAVMVKGKIVSSNRFNKINSATARVEEEDSKGGVLVIEAPNMRALKVPFLNEPSSSGESSDPSSIVEVDVFGMKGLVRDEGDEAAEWLKNLLPLAQNPRLVRVVANRWAKDSPSHVGTNNPTDQIKLHDYAAFHLICQAGVRWLQGQIRDTNLTLTTEQFRANIVLDDSIPFPEEDWWNTVSLGGCDMRVAKQSGRCVIPTIQHGHRPKSHEPTATLMRLRKCFHRHQVDCVKKDPCFMFGLDLFHSQSDVGRTISVGDTFRVTSTREAPLYFS